MVKAGEAALKRARASSDGGNAAGDGTPQPSLPQIDARYLLSALDRMDSVFGVFYEPAGYDTGKGAGGDGGDGELGELPEVMAVLLARRLAARESKDWATADAVRDEITALGYAVKVRGKRAWGPGLLSPAAPRGGCVLASSLVGAVNGLQQCAVSASCILPFLHMLLLTTAAPCVLTHIFFSRRRLVDHKGNAWARYAGYY